MSKRIILDVDGPLTDFHAKARLHIIEELGYDIPIHHFREWDFTAVLESRVERDHMNGVVARPGFATSMIPKPEAVAAVFRMRELGHDILFATSPHLTSPTWIEERTAWLKEHFVAADEEIAHIHKKYFLGGDVFIDDKPSHVERWSSRNPEGAGRLFRYFYNEDSVLPFVSSWADVLALL